MIMKNFSYILFTLALLISCTKTEKATKQRFPIVITGLATHINSEGVTFNGSFLQAGNGAVIDHGFVFSTSNWPSFSTGDKVSLGASSGNGSFTATANFAMMAGKTYYVSAYAKNSERIYYADPVDFVSMGALPPEIISIVPSEGAAGEIIVIHGRYFSQVPLNNMVKFGNSGTSIITSSDTELTVTVPSGNPMGFVDIFVTTAGQTAQKINGFRYL